MKKFEKYVHEYGNGGKAEVWVNSDLKGQHRAHCLCFKCKNFNPERREINCKFANYIFMICQAFNMVLPVWECQRFDEDNTMPEHVADIEIIKRGMKNHLSRMTEEDWKDLINSLR